MCNACESRFGGNVCGKFPRRRRSMSEEEGDWLVNHRKEEDYEEDRKEAERRKDES